MDFHNVHKFHNILSFLRYNLKLRLTSQSVSMTMRKTMQPNYHRKPLETCRSRLMDGFFARILTQNRHQFTITDSLHKPVSYTSWRPQAAHHFSQRAAAAMKQDHRNGPHVDLSQNNHRSQLF